MSITQKNGGHARGNVVDNVVSPGKRLAVTYFTGPAGLGRAAHAPSLAIRVAVHALPWDEVPPRANVLLHRGTARGENKLLVMNDHHAPHHVDGRDAGCAVFARLTHNAKGLGAKARLALATSPFAQETDMLRAADPGLPLTPL
jgi:hypothetical protein